jgi:hypothetical protein
MKRRLILTTLLSMLLALPLFPAKAQTVDEVVDGVLGCSIISDKPTFTTMNAGGGQVVAIQGSGGVSNCPYVVVVSVCLDHNLVTLGHTCKPYITLGNGSGGGPTGKTPCAPGIWQTQVTPHGLFSSYPSMHSEMLIVTTECLGPANEPPP